MIKPCLIKCGSDKIKAYVRNFAGEMGEYMNKRTKETSINRLHYFDLMGRAEPIRMLLAYTGICWADVRCTGEDFGKMKKDGKLDFGSMPMLEMDGMKLVQTQAIINYLGSTFCL